MLHVSIKPEVIFTLLGVPVTNSLIASLILTVLFLLIAVLFFYKSRDKGVSSFVFFIRFLLSKLHSAFEPILGKLTDSAFPFIASLFLFVLLSNWIGLLPGFGSITVDKKLATVEEHVEESEDAYDPAVDHTGDDEDNAMNTSGTHSEDNNHEVGYAPLLRGATADFNVTLALALFAFTSIQYFGVKQLGLSYFTKFINFKGPIDFFTGILEIISELSKIISFAFRLFGNIFAGEVLLTVVAFLVPVLASFPFLMLEVFVGFIQALVFAMLTSVFINVAVAEHH